MIGGLVTRPRAATAIAVVIVAAVAITAALFPTSSPTRASVPDFPTHGREEAYGRQFIAIEATEQGKPHRFPQDAPMLTFRFGEWVEIFTGCNSIGGRWKLADGRLEVSDSGMTMVACSDADRHADSWMSGFLANRPRWRLEGNTLQLDSDFGTMTLVDKGAGRDRADILGHRFVSIAIWQQREDLDSSRFSPSVWPRLSITRDGHLRARFGCRVLEADAQVTDGWLVLPDRANSRTQPCSRSMKAHETGWFWDFLGQPLRWQSFHGALTLASESTTLTFEGVGDGMYLDDPDVLKNRTFRSISMDGGGHKRVGIARGEGVTITIDADGQLRAEVGCREPTVRAEAERGWVRYRPADVARDDCPNPMAEEWLDDFFADEPSWHLSRGGLVLVTPRTSMRLVTDGRAKSNHAN